MAKKRTAVEIELQIEGLRKMKETLPEVSGTGTENWKEIDAQIEVLKGVSIADYFYADETAEEYEDGDNDIYNRALEAEEWLSGERDDDLFEAE